MSIITWLSICAKNTHGFLASEPADGHKKRLCQIITWGLLNISGFILFYVIIAPLIYASLIHNKNLATVAVTILLTLVNMIFFLVQEFLKIWNVKTEMTYYYPLLAFISVPAVIIAMPIVWNFYKKDFDNFFKD